jgi:class 3 adenylate cyclase
MVAKCPRCSAINKPGAKFCNECAAPLNTSTPAATTVESRDDIQGERRQLTVMFCDVVGSTPLSEQLDPEDLRELMRSYQEVCVRAITSFDGYVAQYLGDGLLAYFGYPAAHEDDATRAVRAGLAIVVVVKTKLKRDSDHIK